MTRSTSRSGSSVDASGPVAVPWTVPGAWIAAVGGALVLTATNLLVGFTPGRADVQSTAAAVRLAEAHPALSESIVLLGFVAAFLLVPGIWAIAARLASRSAVLAGVGGWLASTGYVASTLLSADSLQTLMVARSDLDPGAYGTAMDANVSPVFSIVVSVFGFGALIGLILLGVAALRQRGKVPTWVGWVLIAAEPVRMVGLILGVPVGPPLASLMIAAGFAGILISVSRVARAAMPAPASDAATIARSAG